MATGKSSHNPLETYWAKRDFSVTAEPRGEPAKPGSSLTFVIQKHAASRLHYDFRLELDGVLLSWALPKGPSFDPSDKRMAIRVEDHPLSYGTFEGTIPLKHYGAGTVIVWDNGTWEPVGDPHAGLANGKLVFRLLGQKLAGLWELVKIAKGGERQEPWILFKKRDAQARARSDYDVVTALPDSVIAKPLTKTPATVAAAEPSPAGRASAAGRSACAAVPGAVKAPLPQTLAPQLATLATAVPAAGRWLYEVKFDGYRILARIDKGRARLITRGGHDWSDKMPSLVAELQRLGIKSAWLDGEIVVLGPTGVPDFNALQQSFDGRASDCPIAYFLFDVPFLDGHDLRAVELVQRRQLLEALLDGKQTDRLRFSAAFDADPAAILQSVRQMNMEGVIAKRADSHYGALRSQAWLKLKTKLRQEFVVCGYTDRSDGAAQIGSLLLGVQAQPDGLVSVGSVGTGWSADEAAQLKQQLAALEVATTAFTAGPAKPGRWSRRLAGSERWVRPTLVAEVEFAEWTPDGQIRHASFVGLRLDKPAAAVVREVAQAPSERPKPRSPSAKATGVKVTHGERVIDPSTGLTKLDLVRYYASVAPWLLPHLKGRPASLVRGPDGVTGQLFFQKHDDKLSIPGLRELDAALWPGHPPLIEVASEAALANAAQMNVIEFHTWNARSKNLDKPDRMVFDLDPGDGTPWQHVQEAATLMRTMLAELGLQCWLKTSGGKGLHVVVPLQLQFDNATVKAFSQAIVQHMAKTVPSRFVAKSGPANRVGKLFVDYLRNGHGATTAAAFSARARPGMGVSMPVSWDDLPTLKAGNAWTVATAREHLSFQAVDPWAGYWRTRQRLAAAMKAMDFEPAS